MGESGLQIKKGGEVRHLKKAVLHTGGGRKETSESRAAGPSDTAIWWVEGINRDRTREDAGWEGAGRKSEQGFAVAGRGSSKFGGYTVTSQAGVEGNCL